MPATIRPGKDEEPVPPVDNPCLRFEQDETAFYEALKADNQRAWNCLYIRMTTSFVPYACQRSAISADDAYDILQDSLAEFSLKLRDGRYVYQDKPVAAYVFIVCRNRWATFLKKNKLTRLPAYSEPVADEQESGSRYESASSFSLTVGDDDTLPELSDPIWAQSDVDWEAVSRAFSELGDDCRTLLHCFYVEGKSLKDCGEVIGLQENSAKVKRFRCAQRLKTLYMNYRKDE